jgi:hypothetical protein
VIFTPISNSLLLAMLVSGWGRLWAWLYMVYHLVLCRCLSLMTANEKFACLDEGSTSVIRWIDKSQVLPVSSRTIHFRARSCLNFVSVSENECQCSVGTFTEFDLVKFGHTPFQSIAPPPLKRLARRMRHTSCGTIFLKHGESLPYCIGTFFLSRQVHLWHCVKVPSLNLRTSSLHRIASTSGHKHVQINLNTN